MSMEIINDTKVQPMSNKIVLSGYQFSQLTKNNYRNNVIENFNDYNALLSKYNIVTPKSIAAFFSQMRVESDNFSRLSERYNTGRVVPINTEGDVDEPDHSATIKLGEDVRFFTTRYDTIKVNNRRVRIDKKGHKFTTWRSRKHEDKLVDNNHLGNTHPGDGSLFRGRGFLQNTGRANYETITKKFENIIAPLISLKIPRVLRRYQLLLKWLLSHL